MFRSNPAVVLRCGMSSGGVAAPSLIVNGFLAILLSRRVLEICLAGVVNRWLYECLPASMAG